MANLKISKTIIIFFSFFLLLFLHPSKTSAQEKTQIYTLSGSGMQTIYLPGPVKVNKVNIYACSVQNRNGGFQLGITLLYNNIQVAQKFTLAYARSGCPMWSYAGSADGTALDFGGTSADAIKIIPVVGDGSYYQMFVSYEENYEPPPIQCGTNNTIAEYFNFGGGDFVLPSPVKVHLVNAYACSVQNRGGGYRLGVGLFYNAAQAAYKGTIFGWVGYELAYGRSGCPMWAWGASPPATALNFGGVMTDTIKVNPIWGAGGIYRIFYTHEPEACNLSHKACQNNSCIVISGAGADQCSSNAECIPSVPAADYVIDPPFASKQDGQTQQFIGWYDPDGLSGPKAQEDRTTSASWSSSNTSVATVNSSGLASCVSSGGPITIASVYSGITATASLTCTAIGPFCGDGTCNGTETCSTCVADCGACGSIIIEARGPAGSFTPGSITIDRGQSADIRWKTSGIVPNSCVASNTTGLAWSGAKPDNDWPSGELVGPVSNSTKLTLACTDINTGFNFSNSVDINVTFRPWWKEVLPW